MGEAIHDLEDVSFWKAMAGPTVHIPAVGAAVIYYPYKHAEACGADLPDGALPIRILATLTARRLRTNGFDVFAEFDLQPMIENLEEELIDFEGGQEGAIDEEVAVFTKRLPIGEVLPGGNSCYISNAFAATLFPALLPGAQQDINYTNLAGQQRLFVHRRQRGGNQHQHLGRATDWLQFKNEHNPEFNELLIIARRGNDDYRVGLRRNLQRSDRPAPEEIQQVQDRYIHFHWFRVRYYPNVSSEYVVSARALRRGNQLNIGAMVEFVSEGPHGNSVVVNGEVVQKEGHDYAARITVVGNNRQYAIAAWKVRPDDDEEVMD